MKPRKWTPDRITDMVKEVCQEIIEDPDSGPVSTGEAMLVLTTIKSNSFQSYPAEGLIQDLATALKSYEH